MASKGWVRIVGEADGYGKGESIKKQKAYKIWETGMTGNAEEWTK